MGFCNSKFLEFFTRNFRSEFALRSRPRWPVHQSGFKQVCTRTYSTGHFSHWETVSQGRTQEGALAPPEIKKKIIYSFKYGAFYVLQFVQRSQFHNHFITIVFRNGPQNTFSFRGASPPDPPPGTETPLGAQPPYPHYRLAFPRSPSSPSRNEILRTPDLANYHLGLAPITLIFN